MAMPAALCHNEECGHEWTLTKPAAEYSRGWPSCPECGTTRVTVDGAERPADGAARAPGGSEPDAQATAVTAHEGQAEAAPPATAHGNLPSSEDAMRSGMEAADILSALQSDDSEARAAAKGRGLKALGSLAAQYGDHVEREHRERRDRARNAEQDDLRVVDEYVNCPQCDVRLTNLPSGEFNCPECGVPLEYTPPAEA